MHIVFIASLLALLVSLYGFSPVDALSNRTAACPGGNPVGSVCTTCAGSTPEACSGGGCKPRGGYTVTYCGTQQTTNVQCAYCDSGYKGSGTCTVTSGSFSLQLSCNSSSSFSSKSPSSGSTTTSSSSSSGCFSSSETLTLEYGSSVTMDKVQVGDMIMVSSKDGKTSFSPVIVIPHPVNSEKAEFVQLSTESGRDIKMTANHLIMGGTCGSVYSLKETISLSIGDCVLTTKGEDIISNIKSVDSFGIYTVVTASDEYLVVNGIVVSPFASNHMVANNFYNIHRAIYKFAPYIASHFIYAKAVKAFGDIIDVLSA